MKTCFFPSILVLLFASALLTGCSHSTQVTNNTTKMQGPLALQTQNPAFPIILVDTLNDTLTGVFDTVSLRVTGLIYKSDSGTTTEMFLNDSDQPERAILGQYEIFFANYTDTSVDVAITDTAGDIGVKTNIDIMEALSLDSVHTTLISRTMKKGAVPQNFSLSQLINYLSTVKSGIGLLSCELAAISAIEAIGTEGASLLTPGALWKIGGCAKTVWDYIKNLGPSLQNASPNALQAMLLAWAAGQAEDQGIGNKPGTIEWTVQGPYDARCPSFIGSYFLVSGPSTFPAHTVPSGSDNNCSIAVNPLNRYDLNGSIEGCVGVGISIGFTGKRIAIGRPAPDTWFGQFSGTRVNAGGTTYTVTGAFRY